MMTLLNSISFSSKMHLKQVIFRLERTKPLDVLIIQNQLFNSVLAQLET